MKPFMPSKRRLDEARKQGTILKSPLVTASAGFIGVVLSLLALFRAISSDLRQLATVCIEHGCVNVEPCVSAASWIAVYGTGIPLLCGCVAGVIFELLQVGVRVDLSLVAPRFDRLDVAKGGQRLFSSMKELPILTTRLLFALVVFCLLMRGKVGGYLGENVNFSPLIHVVFGGGVLLLVAAAAEYLWKRHQFYSQLSMSHEEVRQETKEQEGDPHIRAHRRALHEAWVMQDIVQRVRKAKVIVVE